MNMPISDSRWRNPCTPGLDEVEADPKPLESRLVLPGRTLLKVSVSFSLLQWLSRLFFPTGHGVGSRSASPLLPSQAHPRPPSSAVRPGGRYVTDGAGRPWGAAPPDDVSGRCGAAPKVAEAFQQ